MRALGLVVVAMLVGACSNADAGDSVTGDQSAIVGGKETSSQPGVGIVRFFDWNRRDLEARGLFNGIACTGTLVTTDRSPAVTRAVLTASSCVTPLVRAVGDRNDQPGGFADYATFDSDGGSNADPIGVDAIYTHGAFALLVLAQPVAKAKPVQLWNDDDAPMWVRYFGYGCSSPTATETSGDKHQLDADWDDATNRPKGGSVYCDRGDLGGAVFDRPFAVSTGPLYAIMTGQNSYATIASDRNWIRASIDGLRR